ncbi:MAG: hypothetical protein ACJ741_12665 [Pyrinomonadaceae bacterium]
MGDRESANQAGNAGGATREEEATSGATLGDLEENESDKTTKGNSTSSDAGDGGSAMPSPDGAFDAPRGGRADGSDAGEPM